MLKGDGREFFSMSKRDEKGFFFFYVEKGWEGVLFFFFYVEKG